MHSSNQINNGSENSVLKSVKEGINKKLISDTHCRGTAYALLRYMCNNPRELNQGEAILPYQYLSNSLFISDENTINNKIHKHIFNEDLEENLFLIEVHDYHTFVIEKLLDENKYKYIIYHSWFTYFDLDWWLGSASGRSKYDFLHLDFHSLRNDFGHGKKLTREELNSFLLKVTKSKSNGGDLEHDIAVAACFKSANVNVCNEVNSGSQNAHVISGKHYGNGLTTFKEPAVTFSTVALPDNNESTKHCRQCSIF